MNLDDLFGRISAAVDAKAYLTPADQAAPAQRQAVAEVLAALHDPEIAPAEVQALVERYHQAGRIDSVHRLSCLQVIACSPRVADYAEAARLAGEQEFAALEQGGPNLERNLASVDRHRGVLAFLRGHDGVALDHFTRALERERSPENLGNVLCALLRLGELDEADQIVARAEHLPASFRDALQRRIADDPDLAALRVE